jgi:predicted nucleic acid-binding protein
LIVDTSVIYALLDRADRAHGMVARWYREADPELVTTPLILAEVDHLAGTRAGLPARAAWRRDLAAGAYLVEWWGTAAREAAEIAETYADLDIGLADASLVALAARLGTVEIATLDQRHFRPVRPLTGDGSFTLHPLDT